MTKRLIPPEALAGRTAATLDVWFALPPESLILDWAGPAEALRMANVDAAATPRAPYFNLRFCGPTARAASSVGAQVAELEPLPDRIARPAWIVVVGKCGDSSTRQASRDDAAVIAWLARLQAGQATAPGLRLVTVCSGALLAAAAGLLNGRRATTHHMDLDLLRQWAPQALVEEDRVFVHDGDIWSSAGVTAGIDLALHLVSEHCGPLVAARVAQRMAVAMRRGPNDPQLSPFLSHRQHLNARLHQLQDAIAKNPHADWGADRMARVVCTSSRTLHRMFVEHAGIAPLAYVRGIRLAHAQSALAAGSTVQQAAAMAGFHSDLQLRRAWQAEGAAGLPSGRRHQRQAAKTL